MDAEAQPEVSLKEIANQTAAKTASVEVKVIGSEILTYPYETKAGKKEEARKLHLLLSTKDASQYCIGVARMQRGKHQEITDLQKKFGINTIWKLDSLVLDKQEKTAYIHTEPKIAINVRATGVKSMLQSTTFPSAPEPSISLSDILCLKEYQRFDATVLITEITRESITPAGIVCDCTLVDGSKTEDGAYARMPISIWSNNNEKLALLKDTVKATPITLIGLQGRIDKGTVYVSTVKDIFWWTPAKGSKAKSIEDEIAMLCSDDAQHTDVAALKTFVPNAAMDYINISARLVTVKQISDPAALATLLGENTDHICQLNHVFVQTLEVGDSILTQDNRLWGKFSVWDASGKGDFFFRAKAMLQIAGLTEEDVEEYKNRHANGVIQHAILVSLRLHLKRSQKEGPQASSDQDEATKSNYVDVIVVEAGLCIPESNPNAALRAAMHGIMAADDPHTERLVAVPLAKIRRHPFYNMEANGNGADKALALLEFSERTVGQALKNDGFRLTCDRVTDYTDDATKEDASNKNSYGVIAISSFEKSVNFRASKGEVHLVVITKIDNPTKGDKHKADLYIEAMERVLPENLSAMKTTMLQLQQVTSVSRADDVTTEQTAVRNNKCRRLGSYPTLGA